MIGDVDREHPMIKPLLPPLTGLVVLLGILRYPSIADEPAKARKQDDLRTAWIWKYLRVMKEPELRRLAEKDRTATVYRFVWLPSFHDPISVRFVKSDRGVVLHALRLKLDDEYQPVQIVSRKSVNLKKPHWERIANHLTRARFWDLSTHQREPFGGMTLDGHILVVEGVRDGKYHIVVRNNPLRGDFMDLCRAMLFMSGIDVRGLWFEYGD
jgi:hypothetical protein